MAKHGYPGNPGGKGPISTQGGRKTSRSAGTPRGTNTPATWPSVSLPGTVSAQRGAPGGRGPLSGHGGGRGSKRKATRGTGAPGAAGIGSTN